MQNDAKKSLQEHCLECIIKNLNQLVDVYNSTSSSMLLKSFEFLQRIYSKTLLQMLSKADGLRNKYLAFLINPHLKHLDLQACYFLNVDIIIERLKVMGNYIVVLDARREFFPEDIILELLTLVPNVETVYLSRTKSTDNVLNCIANHCASLHTLDVSYCNITLEGLKNLCKKKEDGEVKENCVLRNLYISCTSIGEDGISFALTYFPALEELDYNNVGGTIFKMHKVKYLQDNLDSLRKYNLRNLDIHTYNWSFPLEPHERLGLKDVLKVCSVLCPQVSCLSVVSEIITQADVLVCVNFPQLKKIKFCSSSDLIDYDPFIRACGQSLVQVSLDNGILSAELLGKCCPNLEKLMLQLVKFKEIDEAVVKFKPAPFQKLKFLHCRGIELIHETGQSVSFLINSSPVLEVLRLQCCSVTEAFVTSLIDSKCMTTLRKLDLNYSETKSTVVQKIVANTLALQKLCIEECDISNSENNYLQELFKHENRCVEVKWKNSNDYEGYRLSVIHPCFS